MSKRSSEWEDLNFFHWPKGQNEPVGPQIDLSQLLPLFGGTALPAQSNPLGSLAPLQLSNRLASEDERRQTQSWNITVLTLECLRSLSRELLNLREEVRQLQESRTFVVPLATLSPMPLEMVHQIPVTVQGSGEEFTATFTEANVSASGETEADAIAAFKESLLESFRILETMKPEELGPLPTRQWQVLQSVVRRID